jgi:FkbM family methyltransferase
MLRQLLQKSVNLIPWRMRSLVKRIPVIRSVQQVIVSRLLSGKSFIHRISAGPARGACFRITLPEDKLLWTGTWEDQLAGEISRAVQKGDVCFDIGAYRGFFSAVMALAGASRVYAFEPNPDNIVQFKDFQSLNPGLPVELMAVAAGAHGGEQEFMVLPERTMGRLATSSFQSEHLATDSYRVKVVSLDDVVESGAALAPSVMKIDVEGSELEVLRGARELLTVRKPRLFIEAHSPELARDCTAYLAQLGYSIVPLVEDKGPQANRDISHLVAVPR